MTSEYLHSVKQLFRYYKVLGEKTFDQVNDEQLHYQYNGDSNSMSTIVKHLWGNMMSRWTDFLTADGEKEWRERDAEFYNDINSREDMMSLWNEGWNCLFGALDQLSGGDLTREVFMRNQGHTVIEAINRQLAHYAYHVGQIVYLGKMLTADHWQSLSIPKGQSKAYNAEKFAQPKRRKHFTDEYLKNDSKDEE